MVGWRSVSLVGLLAVLVYNLKTPFSPNNLEPSLAGKVAVVTGGSRGIGKGIAIGLGEAGATVYITGRKSKAAGVRGSPLAGSIEETCALVEQAGGRCVPAAINSADDQQLKEFFAQVVSEHGHIDILVNNAFSAVPFLDDSAGKPFWEKGPEAWDTVNNVGLRSHYVASVFAATHMTKAGSGLIINVGSFGGLNYIFDVAYGIGKAAMDRMANDMAVELATDNVTMISLWPGMVATENLAAGAISKSNLTVRRGHAPGPQFDLSNLIGSPLAETPLFVGRAVAAFARDRSKFDFTGKVLVPAVLAAGYGVLDERGLRSPPFNSIKFLASAGLKSLLQQQELYHASAELFKPSPPPTAGMQLYWNTIPDLVIPGLLMRLGTGSPNL